MICPPEHKDRHDSYLLRYLETGKSRLLGKKRELTAAKKDGTIFPILLGVTEVEYTGKAKMFAAFIEDLTTQKKLLEVEVESAKAEALLLNMLPQDVALRLKKDPGHIADHYPNVAILFADIVGFTKMSSTMSPVEVVKMLNDLFRYVFFLRLQHGDNAKSLGSLKTFHLTSLFICPPSVYSMFDVLVEEYDLNKVKTIGDCCEYCDVASVIVWNMR